MTVWRKEQDNAERRREGHWHEVRRKQDLAASLRTIIANLKQRLHGEEHVLREKKTRHCKCLKMYSTCKRCLSVEVARQEVEGTKKTISAETRSLQEAERSPVGVIQPLPAEEGKALQVLFFLYMPLILRQLSRLSFMAQQMLLPQKWDNMLQVTKDDTFATSWPDHYNSHQASQYAPSVKSNQGADGAVLPGSSIKVPQLKDVSPTHVDHCSSPSDGVWHPDHL
ncbi:unnamed protein product, partial [Discosporangium mesarthrocarpum]